MTRGTEDKTNRSRKGTQMEELKHYKRSSSRRELIRAFVNNQGSTNLLLKHKRKAIAPKKVISLPEATALKQCYIMRKCNKPSKNIMETFQGNLTEKADSNGSD
ncbi:hypothetical protein M514_17089 [Trichuris suis]|uniref:Uncharacterized protein n=1 Tax=Trichuris suis TaxID=68888 RepID=A0A085NMC1_9BILA|nr:hypothetical protein M514_17089 [Trichuris suis]